MVMNEPQPDTIQLDRKITRLVVLGDIHAEEARLLEVLQRESGETTAFVSVGDNVGYGDGEMSSRVCRILVDRNIPSVRGNHEGWMSGRRLYIVLGPSTNYLVDVDVLPWIAKLPLNLRFATPHLPNSSIVIQHSFYDTKNKDWMFRDEIFQDRINDYLPEGEIYFIGHSHRPAFCKLGPTSLLETELYDASSQNMKPYTINPAGRYLVDTGSIGRAEWQKRKVLDTGTYAVLEFGDGRAQVTLKTIRL